jgi:hypothetical protein
VNLLLDCSALLLVEAAQSLPYQFGASPNIQGVHSDFPWDGRHVQGTPREHVTIHAEKVDEHCFVFGIQGGGNAHRLTVRAAGVEGDLLDPFDRFKGALNIALVGMPVSGADGDDPVGPDILSLRWV